MEKRSPIGWDLRPLRPTPSPQLAVFLGLIVPGGGHFYLGRSGRGTLWFVLATALTFAGWPLVGAAYLSANQIPLGSSGFALPTALPEVANFLETVFAAKWMGPAIPDTPLRATAPLGFALTASGALLAVLGASDAHWLARTAALTADDRRLQPGLEPAFAAVCAWLVPGLGHIVLGRRAKGALAGGVLLATFLLAVLASEGTVGQRERDQYFWSGEALLGIPFLASSLVNSTRRIRSDLPLAELGLLSATVAGLLNVLLILDAYATAERDRLSTEERTNPRAEAEPAREGSTAPAASRT